MGHAVTRFRSFFVNIASAVATISSASQGAIANDVSLLVLKKAQDAQASAALALVQAIKPALATQGSVGTQLNAFA
jgi:hypothetical protein